MNVSTALAPVPRNVPALAPPSAAVPETAEKSEDKPIPNYTGPADGQSHYDPKAARWLRPANKLLMGLAFRKSAQGLENIPQTGSHIVCFGPHHSYLDAPLASSLSDRDWRFMAAKEQFTGPIGKAMTAMGAFPVERGTVASKHAIEVAIKLLDDGKGMCIFPEGRFYKDGQIHDVKEGTALMAMHSKCETVVPAVLPSQPHTPGLVSKLANYAAATAVVAGGIAVALYGGPAAQIACGVLSGAVSGTVVGGAVGFATAGEKDFRPQMRAAIRSAGKAALLGAAVGGIGAGLLGGHGVYLAVPLSLCSGIATLGIGKLISARDDARIIVGPGIPVEPYRQMENKKEARQKLTADIHQAMVELNTRALQR